MYRGVAYAFIFFHSGVQALHRLVSAAVESIPRAPPSTPPGWLHPPFRGPKMRVAWTQTWRNGWQRVCFPYKFCAESFAPPETPLSF